MLHVAAVIDKKSPNQRWFCFVSEQRDEAIRMAINFTRTGLFDPTEPKPADIITGTLTHDVVSTAEWILKPLEGVAESG